MNKLEYGDWGLGIGDWGLGIGPNPQSPIPNLFILYENIFLIIIFYIKLKSKKSQKCLLFVKFLFVHSSNSLLNSLFISPNSSSKPFSIINSL